MKKILGKLKPKKKLVIIIALVICVGGGAIFTAMRKTAQASEANMEGTSVVEVSKQDLTKSIAVSGTISSAATYNVSSEVINVLVKEVKVQVGDEVKAGDVLAVLDTTTLEKNLQSAQSAAGIASQQGNIGIAEAERSYNATVAGNDTAVARAQQALNTAVATRDAKNQKLAAAQATYNETKAAYDAADDATKATMKESLDASAAAVDTAKNDADAANVAVTTAQQALDDANTTRTKSNADSADALQRSKLSAASGNQTAGDTVRQAKEQIGKATLVAPADGIVTAVNFKAGDVYTGTTMIVIQDVSGYKVSATLGQYDISDVFKDMKAKITTDTTGDEEMTGVVTFVSPTPAAPTVSADGAASSTATGYPIEVTIDNPSERLRIGMNAKLTIILDSKKGALAIPSSALQQEEDGSYYVEVAEDSDKNGIADSEEFTKVPVTQGLVTDYYVEVSGDIKEGMFVVIPEEDLSDLEISSVGLF